MKNQEQTTDLTPQRNEMSFSELSRAESQGGWKSEITVYTDRQADQKLIAQEVVKLKHAFPTISKEFANVLSERIYANNFTEERIRDAVAYVLDNFRYKQPTIADVISFDKRVKVYSYTQILNMLVEIGPSVWNDYKPVKVEGVDRTVYVNIAEAESLGLKYKLVDIKTIEQ